MNHEHSGVRILCLSCGWPLQHAVGHCRESSLAGKEYELISYDAMQAATCRSLGHLSREAGRRQAWAQGAPMAGPPPSPWGTRVALAFHHDQVSTTPQKWRWHLLGLNWPIL